MTKTVLLILCLAVAAVSPRGASATEDDVGGWMIFSSTDAFQVDGRESRWRYWFDAQARYFDVGSGINQYLIRPGVGYQIGDNLSAWAGYARFRTRRRDGSVADENRYWQHFAWTAGQWYDGTVTMRARLEERSVSTGEDLGLVLRYLVRYTRPLGSEGKTSLILGIEPFVDLKDTDWGGDSGLGRMRTSIGIGWQLSSQLSVETGYMNQYVWVDGSEDVQNHLGIVNFKLKLR